jgi:putative ABC transport system permease protein
VKTDYKGENSSIYASSVPALGPAVAEAFPEINAYTRFVPVLTVKPYCVCNVFRKERLKYTGNADNGFYADTAFLKIFSFPIVAGHTEPLSKPYAIAITQSYAEKIFGTLPYSNILGSSIEVDAQDRKEHVITAIVADPPANSHIHFDYLISYATINSHQLEGNLGWSQFYTY